MSILERNRRFDLKGKFEGIKQTLIKFEGQGLSEISLHLKEEEMVSKVVNSWFELERECDAHNVNEAFRLMKEQDNEKDKLKYIRFNKKLLKEMGAFDISKPIKWEKYWDYGD